MMNNINFSFEFVEPYSTNITQVVGSPKIVYFFPFKEVIYLLFAFYLFAYLFHELGHYLMASRFKLRPEFKGFGVETQLDGTLLQQLKVTKAGIIFGFIPIFFSFWSVSLWFIVLIPFYLFGCRSDFKNIKRLKNFMRYK